MLKRAQMIPCAYCDVDCEPTREHVIPQWYIDLHGIQALETFNGRNPVNHTQGPLLVKDVCARCNNQILGELDQYGKAVYDKYCHEPIYLGESCHFDVDSVLLKRWLLKLCFNSGRMHGADTLILSQYREFILGKMESPRPFPVYVHLISPTDFSTDPPTAATRPNGDRVVEPVRWFRFGQLRVLPSLLTDVVQRQVYIGGLCFTLFVRSPKNPKHFDHVARIIPEFQKIFPQARIVPDSGSVRIQAGNLHALSTMAQHISNFPTRYLEGPHSGSADFVDVMTSMAKGKVDALIIQITKAEIDAADTTNCEDRLSELVATRESATSAMSRVILLTDGFDDDKREIWEIPDARSFFRRLFDKCPFLFFLAMPQFKTLDLLAACCCRHEVNGTSLEFNNADDMKEFLEKGFRGINSICQRHGLSYETNCLLTDQALSRFV